ncbi:MAG: membrane protein insertion efficiency factor YidD [Candidatus Latescibacterota bacterium]|nr:MAG: membrane protein insertion efficiency factor YidD [Candidatus Latescibacterota bacterium]
MRLSANIANLLIFLVHLYRKLLSPLKPPSCRFHPTCSEYAILALRKYGPIRGLLRSLWRVLRCNPLYRGNFVDFP